MPRQIRFTFLAEGVSAVADLREEDAPATCDAVWKVLPVTGVAHHAVYSGSEGVLVFAKPLRVDPENATSEVVVGDVGFTWFAAGSSYSAQQEFAEVCWFYDHDARPSMPEGPVPVSLFARFREGSEAFYAACKRMKREGVQAMVIERVEEEGIAREREHVVIHHSRHSFSGWPLPAHAPDGALLVAFTQGTQSPQALAQPDPSSLPVLVRSLDEGRTWSASPEAIGEYIPFGSRAAMLLRVEEGVLLARFVRYQFAAEARAGTPGYEDYQTPSPPQGWIYRFAGVFQTISYDQGRTWEEARPIDTSPPDVGSRGDLIRLRDERRLRVYEHPDEPASVRGAVSADNGQTWQDFPIRTLPGMILGHPTALSLDDGRILCVYHLDATTPRGEPAGSVCGIHGTFFRLPAE